MGCQKHREIEANALGFIIGNWSNAVYTDSTILFTKSVLWPENEYAVSFQANNRVVERKNIGFCGTPPITYGDFEGNWLLIFEGNSTTIEIQTTNYAGPVFYKWKILSISEQHLEIKILDN